MHRQLGAGQVHTPGHFTNISAILNSAWRTSPASVTTHTHSTSQCTDDPRHKWETHTDTSFVTVNLREECMQPENLNKTADHSRPLLVMNKVLDNMVYNESVGGGCPRVLGTRCNHHIKQTVHRTFPALVFVVIDNGGNEMTGVEQPWTPGFVDWSFGTVESNSVEREASIKQFAVDQSIDVTGIDLRNNSELCRVFRQVGAMQTCFPRWSRRGMATLWLELCICYRTL